ncbi:hypothetical protein TNCV_4959341 [Trichonephila clavipes]|uniref:Tc1-like transposase DDE domain-containing protein n=1 Tax=Trichonephila clavipes TaxID=2585209 RepID=A0A8X6VI38_TRICX|nr:hypothetical protein TNCV_4959341 [Trichonephila clavipes]
MDDNAWSHRTLAVEELLESEDITRMDWPAYSPDLNLIEHVMGTPTARNVAPAGSEYAETVRSNHCSDGWGIYHIKEHLLGVLPVG